MTFAILHPRTWPVWDLFFPPLCAVCSRTLAPDDLFYCGQCWADAPVADPRDLHKMPDADMVRAGFAYGGDDVVERAVRELKYNGARQLAEVMAQRLLPRVPTRFVEADVVWCEVPLHWRRKMMRGFNQSQLIARNLAKISGHDAPRTLLVRKRYTPTQTTRSHRERAANVQEAFSVTKEGRVPKAILLIDDVITTGATLNECARTLKAAGAEWVGALAFALARQQ